jgi:MFS family permease
MTTITPPASAATAPRKLLHFISRELGLPHLVSATRDVHILLICRFLRLFAFGAGALVLALYLSALGHPDSVVGLYMTLALLFDAGSSLLLTVAADGGLGRRGTLLLCAARQVVAGLAFVGTGEYWVLVLAAVIGIVSPGGTDVGPFRAVEESSVAKLTRREDRAHVFAWFYVVASLGAAGGLFGAGILVDALGRRGRGDLEAYRAVYWAYAASGVVQFGLTLFLSKECELGEQKKVEWSESDTEPIDDRERSAQQVDETEPLLRGRRSPLNSTNSHTSTSDRRSPPLKRSSTSIWPSFLTTNYLSHISRPTLLILLKLTLLYTLNFIASGMIPHSLLNAYMDRTFHIPKSTLGSIMSTTQLFAAFTNLFAAPLAARIGLVPAMVLTNFSAAIALMLVPVPRALWAVVLLLVLRSCLNTMGKAPRSAFQSAILLPSERTSGMGWLNVVKGLSQAVGPSITGVLAGEKRFWAAFVVAGALRVAYDIGLLVCFGRVRYPADDDDDEEEDEVGSDADEGIGQPP